MCGPRSAADVGRNFSLQSRRDLSPEIERGKAILLQLVKSKTQICALGHMSRQLNELNCRRTIMGGQNRSVAGLRGR